MFTIKAATGKEFDSDYAVSIPEPPIAFVRIVGLEYNTVKEIFSNPDELPIDRYPNFHTVSDFIDEETATKLILKP